MRIEALDTVFIRARRRDLHRVLVDLAGYRAWWPGASSTPAPGGARLVLRPPRLLARPQRFRATVVADRPGLGVRMRYEGDLAGEGEWYYLDEFTGTLVHYRVRARTAARGGSRRLDDHRAAIRAGLNTLKDLLESGRPPGLEPDPQLLADQAAAAVEFAEGVAAHARKVAAERQEQAR